jgi:hypothetical protein
MASATTGTTAAGNEYHPRVADFERREDGSPIRQSLKGPAIIEARQQIARERIVHGAEMKLLQERLRTCYHESGVNHYEDCKELAALYVNQLKGSTARLQGLFEARK